MGPTSYQTAPPRKTFCQGTSECGRLSAALCSTTELQGFLPDRTRTGDPKGEVTALYATDADQIAPVFGKRNTEPPLTTVSCACRYRQFVLPASDLALED
jgi:hypothetical protein